MRKIIGGGLAGISAGISLLTRGEKATIFEQFSNVGMSIGRDAMAVRNYDLPYDQIERFSGMGLKIKHFKPISRIIKYAPSGKMMEVYSKDKPLFYVVLRDSSDKKSLDMQLLNNFESEGGEIKFNQRKDVQSGDIIATRGGYVSYWCFGYEYVDANVDPETIHFFIDHNYAPNGYFALIPWGKHEFSFGIAIGKSPNSNIGKNFSLPDLLEKFIKNNRIVSDLLAGSSIMNAAGGTAYSNIPKTAKINNKLFVGSAAGFLDAARFFGVKYALESGFFAGKALAQNIDYDALWKEAFEKELLEAFYRKLVLDKMTNDDFEKLILEDKLPVQKYDKFPSSMKNILRKIEFSNHLRKWREQHDLKKLF